MSWVDDAPCRGSGLPFTAPDKANPRDLAAMLAMCDACPVLAACEADMDRHRDYHGLRAGRVFSSHNGYPWQGKERRRTRCGECGTPLLLVNRNRAYCSDVCRREGVLRVTRERERRQRAERRRA